MERAAAERAAAAAARLRRGGDRAAADLGQLTTQHGYAQGCLAFWTRDYFRFGTIDGIALPTWNHLWFVVYLWVYGLVLAAGCAVARRVELQAGFDRAFAGWRAVVVPAAYVVLLEAVAFHRVEDTHDLVTDGVAHLRYLPALRGASRGISRRGPRSRR